MIKYCVLLFLLFTFSKSILSQNDSTIAKRISVSGYIETYYIFDFNKPSNSERPNFFYSYNRHNEFNLNLGYIKANYSTNRVQANIGLMAGTYTKANLSQEPVEYRNILEANISYKIMADRKVWLTAGIFPSHIGFESAVGADCINMTRSIMAENSPYFLSGLKLYGVSNNDKWTLGLIISNGWQRIAKQADNQLLGFGHQLIYKPNDDVLFNSSSYVGSEYPDSIRRMRYFHDFYSVFKINERLNGIVGFDIGFEQKRKRTNNYNVWYAPIAIIQYKLTPKLFIGGRIEHYNDENEAIVGTNLGEGFSTFGYSINVDFLLNQKLKFRIEGRSLSNKRNIYSTPTGLSNNNTFVGASLSVKL